MAPVGYTLLDSPSMDTAAPAKPRFKRLDLRKAAKALLAGATLAEVAIAAGSTSTDEHVLRSMGWKLTQSKRVRSQFASVDETLQRGWEDGTRVLAKVAQGIPLPGQVVTHFDQANAWNGIGRALGKFVTRVDVTHTGVIQYARLAGGDEVETRTIIEAAQTKPTVQIPATAASLEDAQLDVMLAALTAEKARRAMQLPASVPPAK